MTESSFLSPLLERLAIFVGERLQTAPFQTFAILVSVHLLSIVAVVFFITQYWPLSDSASAKPQLRRHSCNNAGCPDAKTAGTESTNEFD